MLQKLAEITMALATALGRLARDKAAEGDAKAAGDLGIVVSKVGRAVRQTIHYRRKIEDQRDADAGKRAGAEAEAAGQRAQANAAAKRSRSVARKDMVRRAVERVLENIEDGDSFDDLYERLDEYESFTDFTDRPVSAFVSDICNAMGLEIDWDLFAYDPWAVREAETRPEGSPFAEWWASVEEDPPDLPLDARAAGPPLAAE